MSRALCENPDCRAVAEGGRVCARCRGEFVELLARLPVLHARCGELLQGERTRRVARARGGRRQGIALREALVEARAEILALAASWAALVVDEVRPPRRPRRDVPTLVNFLLSYRDWLLAHPAIGDAIEEFGAVRELAERVIDPGPERIALGPCNRAGCEETVYAQLSANGRGNRLVSCPAGHTWQPHQWLALDQRVGPRRRAVGRGESVA